MNAKDYLEGLRMVEGDLERAMGRIRRCEEQLDLHGVSYDAGSFTSPKGVDRLSAGIVELMEYRESLAAIQAHYLEMEAEADYVIGALSNPARRRALALRYLDNLTYREIGARLGYSTEGARDLCKAGVRDLDAVLVPLLQERRNLTPSASES